MHLVRRLLHKYAYSSLLVYRTKFVKLEVSCELDDLTKYSNLIFLFLLSYVLSNFKNSSYSFLTQICKVDNFLKETKGETETNQLIFCFSILSNIVMVDWTACDYEKLYLLLLEPLGMIWNNSVFVLDSEITSEYLINCSEVKDQPPYN